VVTGRRAFRFNERLGYRNLAIRSFRAKYLRGDEASTKC
jgi:hypothetical protein